PKPKVILLDLMMPVMGGYQFRHKLLENPAWADIPVVIMSAERDVIARYTNLAVDSVLKKPMDIDEILEVVAQFH
ncbi:MAG: response regulator, partial [Bdellovibrionia bacterium]